MNEGEKRVVCKMIRIYCRAKHQTSKELCHACNELKSYAFARLDRCIYGEKKPTCSSCPVHCYREGMKLRIKAVMRFAGPRMLFFYPIDTVEHFYREHKRKKYYSSTRHTNEYAKHP